jgi:predicted aspartyl protease
MPTKDFDQVFLFREFQPDPNRPSIWLPLVEVTLVSPTYGPKNLPLYLDTGASVTTLKAELYPLIGLQRWDEGIPVQTSTGGGEVTVYQYTATLEIFGKTIVCPIHLSTSLVTLPPFVGLLGRNTVFNEFGFGFWERTHELYVTGNP